MLRTDRLRTVGLKNRWGGPVMNPKPLISSFGHERDPKPGSEQRAKPPPQGPQAIVQAQDRAIRHQERAVQSENVEGIIYP
jgi:hypothetical protein